jgi:hypothetical protein
MNEKPLSRADIQRERESLKKRLADLDAAERVLDTIAGRPPISGLRGLPATASDQKSIKWAILQSANDEILGTSASEIAEEISKWKPGYPVTNVSPKLSLYGSQGLIRNQDGRWFLTEKGKKELEKITPN